MFKVPRVREKKLAQYEKPRLNFPTNFRFITEIPIFQGNSKLELPDFWGDSFVPERNLLEKWGSLRGLMGEGRPEGLSRTEGESQPLRAGRTIYFPSANPERVTFEALKRRSGEFPRIGGILRRV
jgi:hypothetical protein